jgi:hypothetical protein
MKISVVLLNRDIVYTVSIFVLKMESVSFSEMLVFTYAS